MIDLNKSKGVSIEILDTTTNELSSYSSIRQAAEAVGCVHRTILLAERSKKEGISKLIKKRYLIKTIRREFHSFTRSSAQAFSNDYVIGMGDGYFSDGCLKICTDNFTKDEVLRLIDILVAPRSAPRSAPRVKFGINAFINKRTNPDGKVK